MTAPVERRCGQCGGPLGNRNRSGFCTRSDACNKANAAWFYQERKAAIVRGERFATPKGHTQPRPVAVVNGCFRAMRECLLDLQKYAQRGIDQLDAITEGFLDAKPPDARSDEEGG